MKKIKSQIQFNKVKGLIKQLEKMATAADDEPDVTQPSVQNAEEARLTRHTNKTILKMQSCSESQSLPLTAQGCWNSQSTNSIISNRS